MTSNDTKLINVDRSTTLQPYASRDEVRELCDRLMAMHPSAKKIGPSAMLAVAQLAVLLGANPLPGANELSVWESGGRIVTNLGVNFWRRKAQEWGGIVWQIKPRPMKDDELKLYDVPDGNYAAICSGVRSDEMMRWKAAGFTVNEIWDMAGVTGIGVSGKNEQAKNGRPSIWTAIKRAEVDALRHAFPVEFGAVDRTAASTPSVVIVDHEYTGNDTEEDEQPYTVADANWDLFGIEPPAAPVDIDFETGEIIEGEVTEGVADEPEPELPPMDELQYANGDAVTDAAKQYYAIYAEKNGKAPEDYKTLKTWYAKWRTSDAATAEATQSALLAAQGTGAYTN